MLSWVLFSAVFWVPITQATLICQELISPAQLAAIQSDEDLARVYARLLESMAPNVLTSEILDWMRDTDEKGPRVFRLPQGGNSSLQRLRHGLRQLENYLLSSLEEAERGKAVIRLQRELKLIAAGRTTASAKRIEVLEEVRKSSFWHTEILNPRLAQFSRFGHLILLWEADDNHGPVVLNYVTGQRTPIHFRPGAYSAAAFSDDQRFLALGSYHGLIQVFEVATGEAVTELMIKDIEFDQQIDSMVFFPGAQKLGVAHHRSGDLVQSKVPYSTVQLLPQTSIQTLHSRVLERDTPLHSVMEDGERVLAWEPGRPLILLGQNETVGSFQYAAYFPGRTRANVRSLSPNLKSMVVKEGERKVYSDRHSLLQIDWDNTFGARTRTLWALQAQGNRYPILSFAKDEPLLAMHDPNVGTLEVLDSTTGQERAKKGNIDRLELLQLSPDGRHLVGISIEGELIIWLVPSLTEVLRTGVGKQGRQEYLDFSPEGEFLRIYAHDHAARVMNFRYWFPK
jgi:hypothetical protein